MLHASRFAAKRRDERLPQDEIQHVVTFRLAGQVYALPIETVVQIIPMLALTPIPQSHPALAGLANLRGVLIPVINLRTLLGLPPIALRLHTPILWAQWGQRAVGLIVDEVLDVMRLRSVDIVNPHVLLPDNLSAAPILTGLVQTAGGAVFILSLELLFALDVLEIGVKANSRSNGRSNGRAHGADLTVSAEAHDHDAPLVADAPDGEAADGDVAEGDAPDSEPAL